MPTRRVRQADLAEGIRRQLEIVISTLQLLAIVFPEEAPHNIFGPFGRDRPTHTPECVDSISPRTRSQQYGGASVYPRYRFGQTEPHP
jgi:hypothetical protein